MTQASEAGGLPDPAAQVRLHPLDLDDARVPFRRSWLISTLAGPPVGLLTGALVWIGSRSPFAPLLVGASVIAFGQVASRYYRKLAWGSIPQSRQDRHRPLPLSWDLAPAMIFGALLVLALALVAFRLDHPDVTDPVRGFVFGFAAVAALLVAGDSVVALARGDAGRRRALLRIPVAVAFLTGVALAYPILFEDDGIRSPTWAGWGAAAMLAIGVAVGIVRYRRASRPALPARPKPGRPGYRPRPR